ncbi:hypothetical protein [Anaeroglobus geminatus]|uniref:Uncharacterized protein n=1 Tax=Anaeroglobus geminatus F0357 TaxID=861450 RepID=G9YK35_9FIRM|nr:hypothetical protein [Anaeroglobus geminatus]EHM37860.1 hypothetical protein HMPREF0080_02044 [Anaeroglobus geminatus F0357]
MKIIKGYIDDILLIAGFVLLVIAGSYVSPVWSALYTAAVECLSGAYLISYTLSNGKSKGADEYVRS